MEDNSQELITNLLGGGSCTTSARCSTPATSAASWGIAGSRRRNTGLRGVGWRQLNRLLLRWGIESHMRFWYLVLGDMGKRWKVIELAGHRWLRELVMLARWDKMGRNPRANVKWDREWVVGELMRKVVRG